MTLITFVIGGVLLLLLALVLAVNVIGEFVDVKRKIEQMGNDQWQHRG